MHSEAMQWVAQVASRIGPQKVVLDQGGRDVNGGIRHLFAGVEDWIAVDLTEGEGVTVVADCAEYAHPSPCDVVVSTELLEHTARGPEIVKNAFESLVPGGHYIITCAAPGRFAHGAWGDPAPAEGEYYQNVEPTDLLAWLKSAGFIDIVIDRRTSPFPDDLRAWARKPGAPSTQDKIAVIVPVVGRPQNAEPFMRTVQTPSVYAICERDDQESIEAWEKAGARVISGEARTFAEKVNLGYQLTSEPWLLLVGDDVRFHMGWEEQALAIAGLTDAKVVGTNDLMVPGRERAVHPVISREFIDTTGASWDGPGVVAHEGYSHWFVDDEIRLVAEQHQVWAYAERSVIEHMHHLNAKSAEDDIYIRGRANAEADRVLFEARKAEHYTPPVVEKRPLKVAVYTIGLNEEEHVERWVRGAQGADYIVIADTGSTDRTVELAEELGATVHRITVKPWRFDMARNTALALLPADVDVCISVDMDEWLQPGWREVIDQAWDPEQFGSAKVTLKFVDSVDPEPTVTLEYLIDRIHAREGSKWVLPCHEVAVNMYKPGLIIPQIVIHHLPAQGKDRAGRDTPLLELGVRENPNDARALYYYARQLFYIGKWDIGRGAFLKYLGMPEAVFDQERSEACRFLSRMVWPDQREKWLLRACYEAPQRREPWAELAMSYEQEGQLLEAAGCLLGCLGITDKDPNNSFHVEPFAWNDDTFKAIIEKVDLYSFPVA